MSQTDHPQPADEGAATEQPVVIKKYANRRLYNTESSSYITLDSLAEMVRSGRDFVVYDARTSDDITRGVLTQIIVEEESKGRATLPTAFLRQLIGFYGGGLQRMMPPYLEHTMTAFARQQEQMRNAVQQTVGNLMPPGFEEVGRQNLALMERAMSLFSPFYRPTPGTSAKDAAQLPSPPTDDFEQERLALRAEIEMLKAELAVSHAIAKLTATPPEQPSPTAEPANTTEPEDVTPARKAS